MFNRGDQQYNQRRRGRNERPSLFPGITDDELHARVGDRCSVGSLALSVSTRGIGFGVQNTLWNSKLNGINPPDIHQLYRACLGIFECKMQEVGYINDLIAVRPRAINMEFERQARCIARLPEPISRIVAVAGSVRHNNIQYFCFLPDDLMIEGNFVPEPEFVVLSNLRKVVTTLANPETPLEYRTNFRERNPIPGTRWSDDNVLLNPNDIIPENYFDDVRNFNLDINVIAPYVNQLETRLSPLKGGENKCWDKQGRKSSFVSTSKNTDRIALNNIKQPELSGMKSDKTIADLLHHLPEGDIDLFWSLHRLNTSEVLEGIFCLLGECSTYEVHHHPQSTLRTRQVCSWRHNISYQTAMMIGLHR